jgi:hypothetical protein
MHDKTINYQTSSSRNGSQTIKEQQFSNSICKYKRVLMHNQQLLMHQQIYFAANFLTKPTMHNLKVSVFSSYAL